MLKKLALAGLMATSVSAFASQYYVVVPVPNHKASDGNILVTLSGYSLPSAVLGRAYSGFDFNSVLQVQGDPGFDPSNVRWSVAGGALPAGLSLSSSGKLTGTPTAAGRTSFQVLASYKTKAGEQAYQVLVADVSVALAASTLPGGVQGTAYSYDLKQNLSVSGDPAYTPAQVSWSLASGSMPSGLQLNADGTVTGTPKVGGTFPFAVQARYLNKSGQQEYQLVVATVTVALDSASMPSPVAGTAYSYDLSQNLTVTGDPAYRGGADVTWALASGALPAGLTLSNGVISGNPTTPGAAAFDVSASYKLSSATAAYSLTVTANIVSTGSTRTWSDGTYAGSCQGYISPSGNYRYAGATGDGLYRVKAGSTVMDVYCDMTRDGGGWTLVQRAAGGSYPAQAQWDVTSAINPSLGSVASAPSSATSWKFDDGTLNQLRSAAGLGVFRMMSDGLWTQKRFWKPFTYGTLTPMTAGSAAITSYADLNWSGAKTANSAYYLGQPGGLSDDDNVWGVFFNTSRTGDAWALSDGQDGHAGCTSSQANCNYTMWVR